jgi:hypothetical protein
MEAIGRMNHAGMAIKEYLLHQTIMSPAPPQRTDSQGNQGTPAVRIPPTSPKGSSIGLGSGSRRP